MRRITANFGFLVAALLICGIQSLAAGKIDASDIETVMRKYQNKYHYVAVVNNYPSKYLVWPQLHCSPAPSYPIDFYGEITEQQAGILVQSIVDYFYASSGYSNISWHFLEKHPEGDANYQTVIVTLPNPQDTWQNRLAQVDSDIDKLIYYRVYTSTTDWLGKSGSGSSINCHWVPCDSSRDDIIENESFGDAKAEAESNWNQSTLSYISGGITIHTSVSHSCDDYCDEWYDYTGYGKYWYASISSKNFKLQADLSKHTGSATCYVKAYKRDAEQPVGSPVVSVSIDNKYHSWQSASVGSEWTSDYLFADTPPVAEDPGSTTCSGTDSDSNFYTAGWAYSDAIVVVQPAFDSETDPVLGCASPSKLVYKNKDKFIVYSAGVGCGYESGETVKGRIIVNDYVQGMQVEVKLKKAFSKKVAQLKINSMEIDPTDTERIYSS